MKLFYNSFNAFQTFCGRKKVGIDSENVIGKKLNNIRKFY